MDGEEIEEKIAQQQRELNEATGSLPSYEIRKYQLRIDALQTQLQAKKPEPKKFLFKRKTGHVKPDVNVQPEQDDIPAEADLLLEVSDTLVISEGTLINTTTHPSLIETATVTLLDLRDADIDLSRGKPYTSVTLRGLHGCTINTYKSTSSVFIDACEDCNITVSAQQTRIHATHRSKVTYKCNGNPIIESSSCLKFINLEGVAQVDDFSDLSGTRKNWS